MQRPVTPLGCLTTNVRGFLFIIASGLVGAAVGSILGGEEGARWGFIVAGAVAFIFPWHRWLRRRG